MEHGGGHDGPAGQGPDQLAWHQHPGMGPDAGTVRVRVKGSGLGFRVSVRVRVRV